MIRSLKEIFRKDKAYNVIESDELSPCKVGEEVLLYSKPGRYKVVSISDDSFIVTCKRWRRTREKEYRTQKHLWSDFKAKVY
jgi:hypothetical protein